MLWEVGKLEFAFSALLQDWKVPDFFPVDLHLLVGEEKRPPYVCDSSKTLLRNRLVAFCNQMQPFMLPND